MLESTNRTAHELAREGCPTVTVVLADRQTGGRGRRGRTWTANAGESVLMSVILRPDINPELAPRYTIAAAVGVCSAMTCRIPTARIKWPNDIVVGRKKLAGILLECSATADKLNYLIVGIGLNVNAEGFDGDIADTATSVFLSVGTKFDREPIIASMLNAMEIEFKNCETDAGFAQLMRRYTESSAVYQKQVSIVQGETVHHGTVTAFDELGRIEILCGDNRKTVFDSGDVSLKYDF